MPRKIEDFSVPEKAEESSLPEKELEVPNLEDSRVQELEELQVIIPESDYSEGEVDSIGPEIQSTLAQEDNQNSENMNEGLSIL